MGQATVRRREFVSSVAAAASLSIVPRHVLGAGDQPAPSQKLNIAGIGVGGMGRGDLEAVSSENIVALCDVDLVRAADTFKRFPHA